MLNVYSSPSHHRQVFTRLFHKANHVVGPNALVIAGDFNRTHSACNAYDKPKGDEL